MKSKKHKGVLKHYKLGKFVSLWKIENCDVALNIFIDKKDEDKLTDLDNGREVFFSNKKAYCGQDYGGSTFINIAHDLSFPISTNIK